MPSIASSLTSFWMTRLGWCTRFDLLCGRGFLRQIHCAFELWRFFFDPEIFPVKLVNSRHVIARERRSIRCLGEFNELFFVVNVRERGGHAIIGEQPLQCRLAERAFGVFEETQLLDLFDPI